MALPKRIKIGGAYYRGYKCAVSSAAGTYVCYIENTSAFVLNGITVIPDEYGAGDSWAFTHYDVSSGGGDILAILAEDMYNIGKNAAIQLDFPAAERVDVGHSLKFAYINTASVALNAYVIAEFVGIKKTA